MSDDTREPKDDRIGRTLPRTDGAAVGRRRRGLTAPDENCRTNVVAFPPRPHAGGGQAEGGRPWATGGDAPHGAATRSTTGPEPRPSLKGSRRSLGVLLPALSLKQPLSGYRPSDAGVLTHLLIAIVAPSLPTLTDVTLPERLHDLAGGLVGGENVNRRRVLLATGAGHAAAYLRRYAPIDPWRLLGCEFDTGNGRVDLAWEDTSNGTVLYDEIKTTNRPVAMVPPAWLTQVARYTNAGQEQHGDAFAGVRLVPLGSLHLLSLFRPGGTVPLSPTRTDPLRRLDGAQ